MVPSARSSDISHELLDGLNLEGQPGNLGSQLLLVHDRLLGQLAILPHRDRVGAVRLQPEVGPDDHGDRGAEDERNAHADEHRCRIDVIRARAGRQYAGHQSLSFISGSSWSRAASAARTAAVIASAVSRTSNGLSSKYFIALPSADSSSCPMISPAFSSRSRCMYSSGREIPSLRASSLTCTRPPDSSATIRK